MSRLDSFITRMQAQRDCLNFLKPAIEAVPGPILEVGLGDVGGHAGDDHAVRIWSTSTGKVIRTLKGHADWVRSLAFSPDGQTLASAGDDREIVLWRVSDGKRLRTLPRHSHSVYSLAFHPNGELLAAVGLYSVMSYAVSQRTQEMGIRMALGAQRWDVLRLVLKEGLRLTLPGLLAGSVIALAAARIVGGMLVNVSASDPLTFASAAAFLALVAALASYLPALRAMRVDPVVSLRNE